MFKFKVGDEIVRVRCSSGLAHTREKQPIGGVFTVIGLGHNAAPVWGQAYSLGASGGNYYAFDCDYELNVTNLENE